MANFYQLIRDMLIAILGGFTGAVISEFAQGRMIGTGAFFMVMFYAIIVLIIIIFLHLIMERKLKR